MRGPDIIATIQFLSTEEGGRHQAARPKFFKCPLEYEGEKFDCALHLENILEPGVKATVPVTFLFPDLIKPRLKVGDRFTLWEMRTIARGIVDKVLA